MEQDRTRAATESGSGSAEAASGLVRPPRVYVDESGQTGEDLMSLDQPIFSLGSSSLTDEDAASILSDAGLDGRRDWKFRKLRRSGPGRRAIVKVLEALTPQTAKFALVHKRYMIVAKIVDQLLEPVLRAADVDLYDRGGQVVVGSAWFFTLPVALGDEGTERFYQAFVNMHRTRSEEAIAEFFRVLEGLVSKAPAPLQEDLQVLLDSKDNARRLLLGDRAVEKNEIDPQVTMPVALFDAWGRQIAMPFEVVHDHSAVLEAWMPQLEPFLYSDMPQRTIGYGERAFTLPLLVANVAFGDSHSFPQIQIADLLAGATAFLFEGMARGAIDDARFHKELTKLDLLPMLTIAVWPEKDADVDDNDARALGQRDPATETADFVAEWRRRRA